ncbi:RDD family protein [Sunxiuqinia elliptica]|uniref:Uncharacterized membrane protein YckC, RDD family n=1 Tax=Sunxiuqinia elliptica TaxID=655355 RepID=A0A1I2HMR5_9BACT|nr:RDD family protein [Sunxiuqinia elliptica]SFF31605.1 Uncharacterized membrane protein YckC, RDD family [Sunxiuqinia elliptica]
MTRDEQLSYCKVCKHQTFDARQGIICGLTNAPADVELSCQFYEEDAEQKAQHELKAQETEILKQTASQSKRFANYLIDLVFYLIFSFFFGIILGLILVLFSPDSLWIFEEDNRLINYALGVIAGMIYYSTLEIVCGRTPAKFITKTKVVDEHGEQPKISTILVRSLCRFIPFEPFSFLGSEGSGWHDRLSKTKVINCS